MKTTTFLLVLFVTLLLATGPLQGNAKTANYRRLLSDEKYGQGAGGTSIDNSHHYFETDNPPVSCAKKDSLGHPCP